MGEEDSDKQLPHPLGKGYEKRMEEARKRWEEVKKDPTPTHELLDIIRRRFAHKQPPQK